MRVRTGLIGILLFAGCAGVLAQTAIDRSFKVTEKSCAGVEWSAAALAKYPNLNAACQSVEERDGKTYVRFQGRVERNIGNGKQLDIQVKDGDVVQVTPDENMVVYINDRKTPVRDLQRGDELNFYVPEDRFAASFAQDTTPAPRYVAVPIVYRETTTVYQEPERTAAILPATASNIGLLIVFGGMLIAIGMMLTIYRRNRNR